MSFNWNAWHAPFILLATYGLTWFVKTCHMKIVSCKSLLVILSTPKKPLSGRSIITVEPSDITLQAHGQGDELRELLEAGGGFKQVHRAQQGIKARKVIQQALHTLGRSGRSLRPVLTPSSLVQFGTLVLNASASKVTGTFDKVRSRLQRHARNWQINRISKPPRQYYVLHSSGSNDKQGVRVLHCTADVISERRDDAVHIVISESLKQQLVLRGSCMWYSAQVQGVC